MGVEFVQAMSHDRVDYSFRSSRHLLAAYEQGVRRDGESYVQGVPRSTLRDVARKLTFAPAGHGYREWHDPRTLTAVTYFYFDPVALQADVELDLAGVQFMPRLFFEDAAIWSTVAKLKRALEAPDCENRLYIEALGVVLVHELIRLNRGAGRMEAPVRGGLATWQQRIVTSYIEEHLSEQVPLATLATVGSGAVGGIFTPTLFLGAALGSDRSLQSKAYADQQHLHRHLATGRGDCLRAGRLHHRALRRRSAHRRAGRREERLRAHPPRRP